MREIFLPVSAISKTEKQTDAKFGTYYKWQKFAALLILYGGISIGLSGLITVCGGYFLGANFSEINQFGAGMIFIAFALMAVGIHAHDRINNPAKRTGN